MPIPAGNLEKTANYRGFRNAARRLDESTCTKPVPRRRNVAILARIMNAVASTAIVRQRVTLMRWRDAVRYRFELNKSTSRNQAGCDVFWSALAGLCALATLLPTAHAAEANAPAESIARHPGYVLLTTKAYQRADLSRAAFDMLWDVWPTAEREKAATLSDDERHRMALARYGLVDSPESGRDVPLGVVEREGGWAMNCLGCHGGKVAGRVIPGLGNSHYALQSLTDDAYEARRRATGQNSRLAAAALALSPPMSRSNGTTNAQTFSVLLTATRDLDLNLSRKPIPRFKNYDLDPPPLWNTKKKERLYIDGFLKKTPRAIMQFVLTHDNSGEKVRGWEQDFVEILAWIESLAPPKYPFEIDSPLAARGKSIFEEACARCHGTYGPSETYPEVRVPLAEVATDDARLKGMPSEHRRFMRDSWLGYYGKYEVVEEPDGYVAPPLNGVWASAPYFHNGSVPTLWHVMHADARPRVWRRTEDGYDRHRVGLEVRELSSLPAEATEPSEKLRYFDTRLYGKSAGGHTFPEELSEDQKQAVLEYLKTL